MDEARRVKQDVRPKKMVQVPKKIILTDGEKLGEENKNCMGFWRNMYTSPKDSYWAKEKLRELYW